jgi:hypothetical protein
MVKEGNRRYFEEGEGRKKRLKNPCSATRLTHLQRQAKLTGAMESRVAEISEKTKRLPSAAPEISKAITSGAETAQKAAQQGIQTEADQSLLVKLLARGEAF